MHIHDLVPFCLAILLITFTAKTTATDDFYCENNGVSSAFIQINETGFIHTRLENTQFYGDNFNCKWVLDAGPDRKIYLKIIDTQLQWAPEGAICTGGYDFVHIKDGQDDNSPTAALWCGRRNPFTIISTERYLSIQFQSNERNPYSYKGANIQFQVFNSTSCAPDWLTSSASDPYCFEVHAQSQDTWINAQMICNAGQANLVAIATENQQDFLIEHLKSVSKISGSIWIGVNKIASEEKVVYLNGSQASMQFLKNRDFQTDEDCFALDISADAWSAAHCTRNKLPFVCQNNKVSNTTLYKIPEGTREIGEQTKLPIILAGVLGSLVVIGAIIGGVFIRIKCCANGRTNNRLETYRNETRRQETSSTNQSAQPLRNAGHIEVPPPSYKEAVGEV